jgi:hypothetical protein
MKIWEIQVNAFMMKNFTTLLIICIVMCACNKQDDYSNDNPLPPAAPPPPNPVPVTSVSITIAGAEMSITSLSYHRQGSGSGGGVFINATNNLQKVTAAASPFYQYDPPGTLVYLMEVSYFTRRDSLSEWGSTYRRVIPRDDKIIFDNCAPLSQKMVRGNFSGTFIEAVDSKEQHPIYVSGNFALVF